MPFARTGFLQTKNLLYERGNMVKHPNFISWEEEALIPHAATIDEIEGLLTQARLQ